MNVFAGTSVAVTMTWTDTNGDPIDPAVVTLRFGYPGNETSWTYGTDEQITKVSTGVYTADIPTAGAAGGTFLIVAEGVGTAVGATSFSVQAPPL